MMRSTPSFQRVLGLAALVVGVSVSYAPVAEGFVLLSANEATLEASPEDPVVTLVWNGGAPEIEEKEKFAGGQYESLDDQAFMRQLLGESLALWNEVPGSYLQLEINEDQSAEKDPEDMQHSLVVEKTTNLSTAASAAPRFDEETGTKIQDCDISVAERKTKAKNLAMTLVHELGHCIGLGHAHTNYNAIMGYARTKNNFDLGADDMAGLIYLYPDPDYVANEPKEAVSCGSVGRGGPFGARGVWLAVLLGLPLAAVALRRHFA